MSEFGLGIRGGLSEEIQKRIRRDLDADEKAKWKLRYRDTFFKIFSV